ncbi:MAG: prepilin peptidase [bacterium]
MFFLFVFFIGLAIGSFANAVIWRLEKEKSIVSERSQCPNCGHVLAWNDLIPLLSFLFLKGKCRYCQKPISWQYPLIELTVAALAVFVFNQIAFVFYPWIFVYALAIAFFLTVVFVYDLKLSLIADEIIYAAIGLTLLADIFLALRGCNLGGCASTNLFFPLIKNYFLAASGASLFFLTIVVSSRGKWMGEGDIKLAFFMGLLLGWPGILVALFSAFFFGAIIGLGLIAFGRKKMKSEVPFAPFLIAGTLIAFFWGKIIIDWYLGFFLI